VQLETRDAAVKAKVDRKFTKSASAVGVFGASVAAEAAVGGASEQGRCATAATSGSTTARAAQDKQRPQTQLLSAREPLQLQRSKEQAFCLKDQAVSWQDPRTPGWLEQKYKHVRSCWYKSTKY
jgi:hypothetical protein